MKLWAISDIHVGYRQNLLAIGELAPRPDDWLILCGDVGDSLEQVELGFRLLSEKFAQLIWVPGNHELWTVPRKSGLRGVARYQALVDLCRRNDVLCPEDPFPVWAGEGGPHVLAPLFALYDYSFRPDEVPVEKAVSWAREKNILCTDEAMLKCDPYRNVADWCTARVKESERRLEAAVAEHDHPLVLIAHFPLLQEHAILPRIPRFMVWCGTRKTEDWHLRFNARTVISGHLHIPCTRYKDGVRFEEVSLGYPDQWDARRERFGWQLEDHLRQILPVPEEDAGDPLAGYSFPP
ncbi:MAG: metallophosphoesterase [bacterium]|nr:metallophosphoesterase [bacterium]